MRIGSTILFIFLFVCRIWAQPDVVALEYFIDTDPGVGAATPLSVTSGPTIEENYIIPVSGMGLSEGFHIIGIRAMDANGNWSMREYRTFVIREEKGLQVPPPPSPIEDMEYFIDSDPGPGNGTHLANFPGSGTEINFSDIANTNSLPEGFHTISIRGLDSDGEWGFYETRTFLIRESGIVEPSPAPDVVELEYFFDEDPGVGQGNPITVPSPGTAIDVTDIITHGLSAGYHIMGMRARDANGNWGLTERRPLLLDEAVGSTPATSKITGLEYFFGDDPGYGNGAPVTIDPAQDSIDLSLNWPTATDIPVGTNTVTVRAKNEMNLWGFSATREFEVTDDCTFPNAQFDVIMGCATDTVTFVDTSFDVVQSESPQYRWYLDDDAVPDSTTIGDVTWIYDIPDTYTVSLAIAQGQTCYDSTSLTFTIKPKPLVLFSTSNEVTGQSTDFSVVSTYVDSTMTWSWDFNGDGIEDDTTSGSTSFVYDSAGTYTTSVVITDPQGCGTSYTADVTVEAADQGGTNPKADFSASIACEGSPTAFTDLSENIPDDATYSWDFDNDGVEDSDTTASVSYTYAEDGKYLAVLTITLSDNSTYSYSDTVSVKPVPVADFTVSDACTGDQITITDNSSDVLSTATYSWDFDGDGVMDDSTIGDVSTTYTTANTYTILLLINNGDGCFATRTKQIEIFETPEASFTTSQACLGEEMTFTNTSKNVEIDAVYSWDLDGDGNADSDTTDNPVFTYPATGTYNASLTIDNGAGCSDVFTKTVSISREPVADIEVIARCFGQESDIIDNSTDVENDATYSWDFDGDGTVDSDTVGSTTFIYPSFDNYVARLTVDNGDGCVSTAEDVVNFVDAAIPDFEVGTSCVGSEVVFTDLSSQLETGAHYSWDFDGDGLEDKETPGSTVYIYNSPGTYDVTLTIDNGNNCLAFKTKTVEVGDLPVMNATDTLLCEAGTVTLDAGAGYNDYQWSDGSNERTLTVNEMGEYYVTVTDAAGCKNTDTASVSLKGPPVADFEFSLLYTEFGISVSFQNLSSNAGSYIWDFGDDKPVDNEFDINPEHLYEEFSFFESTTYEVCLTAVNNCDEVTTCKNLLLSPTGFDMEMLAGLINIYPNPGNGFYEIELLDKELIGSKLQVIDNGGDLVLEQKISSQWTRLDLSTQAKGMYHLRLRKDDIQIMKSLIYQ